MTIEFSALRLKNEENALTLFIMARQEAVTLKIKSFVWVGSVGSQRYTRKNKGTKTEREGDRGRVRDIFSFD